MLPIYLGLFLIAGSILSLEIALTRVFAIMMWHHLAYMVISVAMLGFGAAGSLLVVSGKRLGGSWPAGALAWLSAGYGVGVFAALVLATQLTVDTVGIWQDKSNLARLGSLYVIVFVPFLLGGGTIGLALSRLAAHVNRLYGADLLGSAAGGAASVWLLSRFGSSATVVIAGALGTLAALCFAFAAGRRTRLALLPVAALGGFAAIAISGGSETLGVPPLRCDVPYAPGKELRLYEASKDHVRIPSATAEVGVGPDIDMFPGIGGDFGRLDRGAVRSRLVGQDGTAPTVLFKGAADLSAFPFLDDTQAAAAYVALRGRGGSAPRVLVIGVGGGIDVMVALHFGAASVTGVEINRAMIEAVTERFDAYLGGLFRPGAHPLSDRIELVHGEGRSYVRRRGARYDVIQLSGVDSFTALNTGAYTLSESYLYTTEAIRDLYEHVAEDGYLSFSRFIMKYPRKPRETLRLANIVLTALEEMGVEEPASRIVVFRGFNWASTLVKRGRFTRAEIEALQTFADREGFWGLVFDPLRPGDTSVSLPSHLDGRIRLRAARVLKERRVVLPDSPGAQERFVEALHEAFRLKLDERGHAADRVVNRLLETLPEEQRASAGNTIRSVVQSEVARVEPDLQAFAQTRRFFGTLLAGSPAQRSAFVDGYEYDVTPSTDDAPFFFNYYRYSGLLRGKGDTARARTVSDYYHPDYPVGHVILLASLLQITLLAALCILLPLRAVSRSGTKQGRSWRIFLYFAALGMGFMFIEIVLMQKLVLFLGHPIYAITIVLTTLLAFAGLGSLAASALREVSPRALRLLLGVIVVLVVACIGVIDQVLPHLLGQALPIRVSVVAILLAPLGFVLGMPFPLGIRVVDAQHPPLVPWAWAINAFLSVFSSIFCILLAMVVGFSSVLLLAAAVYAVGLLAFAPLAEAGTPENSRSQ
jgi:hypothetical protein